ncbi:NAD(P)/FAD-dependent oxidoreductase [Peptoniphilus mikwangii]|uniref:NAD(P)/FAD-dependent oxidoreductase n=1 Tax=Peptoniphilus mikwangii TaxID=1354300 RepID=UPI000419F3AA|nr:NAD(P)/FAD-dependent oxidoreductase [Peptoniphilus mikwangii]
MIDVIIIGAGVSGSATARELSRYKGKFLVLEKEEDVCSGTSKANSGIVHGGYDAKEGSLMAKLNVEGNKIMGDLSEELDFPFERIGSLVVCFEEDGIAKLHELKKRGEMNGVDGLEVIDRKRLLELEPNIGNEAIAALHCKVAGIVCPFSLNIALAENAHTNGVKFKFNKEVVELKKRNYGWDVITKDEIFQTRAVVNAAGVYADVFHNMVSDEKIHITARRGNYLLLDKEAKGHINHTVFPLPTSKGKGILASPTVDGNLLIGPTAVDIEDKENTSTIKEDFDTLIKEVQKSVKNIPFNLVITSFCGLRAHEDKHDFIIGEVKDAENFFDIAGIESPGLTASPAIGKMMAKILSEKYKFEINDNFIAKRKGIEFTRNMTMKQHSEKIIENPKYGSIVCRCEKVTEAEIIDAIRRPLGAKTLDGVKRRTRAMAGRCQAGFCTPKIIQILARELGIDEAEVVKNSPLSKVAIGHTK